jgi:putative flippase GtrA
LGECRARTWRLSWDKRDRIRSRQCPTYGYVGREVGSTLRGTDVTQVARQLPVTCALRAPFLKRVVRFGLVGLISTFGVQDPTLLLLAHLGLPKVPANEVALIIATQCSFVMSAKFVWPDRLRLDGALTRSYWVILWALFTSTALAASAVQEFVFSRLLDYGLLLELAFVGGVIVGVTVTFGVNNFFTFRAFTALIHRQRYGALT